MREAVIEGAKVRFCPMLLTYITTFLGVLPLILERSLQAQFLVPIAVSLGFGILVATFIIMLLVPAMVMWQYDAVNTIKRWFGMTKTAPTTQDAAGDGLAADVGLATDVHR